MVAAAMRLLKISRGQASVKLSVVLACGGLLLAGCGGSTQDANEPKAQFALQVLRARFPRLQAVARPTKFELLVHNPGTTTVPNVTVTVNSFYYLSDFPRLADPSRPVWIVDQGPGATPNIPVESLGLRSPGGYTTATSTVWAAGPLAAGETRNFTWELTPVRPGLHKVIYSVAPGLHGRSTVQPRFARRTIGTLNVFITSAPPVTHVNPETGAVEVGRPPVAPGP
jgi:hypothetical protein